MSERSAAAAVHTVLLGVLLGACSGSRDALARGQRYYEENQYERALAVWRDVGRSEASLNREQSLRYAYLRGMTDYRLGFRDEARHWLALARARERQAPSSMNPEWSLRLDGALRDLNHEVFGLPAESADPVQSIEAVPGAAPRVPAPDTP
jgi:hypothetical protein